MTCGMSCGSNSPRVRVWPWDSIRATGSGAYPSSAATSRMRWRVSAEMRTGSLNANETAVRETPAASATSLAVTFDVSGRGDKSHLLGGDRDPAELDRFVGEQIPSRPGAVAGDVYIGRHRTAVGQ